MTSEQDTNPSRPSGLQNFELDVAVDHKNGQLKGTGILYLPIHCGTFLEHIKSYPIVVRDAQLDFGRFATNKDHTTRIAILESPYVPRRERDRVVERSKAFEVNLRVLKLEWGRKGISVDPLGGAQEAFNVYFLYDSEQREGLDATLYFADELQTILIALEDRFSSEHRTELIRIPYAHIKSVERCKDVVPAMIFHLHSSVVFEQYPGGKGALPRPPRLPQNSDKAIRHDGKRLTGLSGNHARVLPLCYRTLRVTLHSHINLLEKMLETAGIQIFGKWGEGLDGRRLTLDQLSRHDYTLQVHLRTLPFAVAFQIESMLLRGLLDHHQMPMIVGIVKEYDPSQFSKVARAMASFAQQPYLLSRDSALLDIDILTTFREHLTRQLAGSDGLPTETKLGWFSCHRVTITPTSKRLHGPFLDQGNRIIRR